MSSFSCSRLKVQTGINSLVRRHCPTVSRASSGSSHKERAQSPESENRSRSQSIHSSLILLVSLSISPAALYSPVRAIPLRPRLHSPNGHRAAAPRQTSTPQPIATAPASHASPVSKPLAGLKSCPLTQTVLGSSQSQRSSLPVANPLSVSSHFECSPSAARQLQIIALTSGRQPHVPYTHPVPSAPPIPPMVEAPETSSQTKRRLSSDDGLPPNSTLPKATSSTPSPPSLLSPASPPSQAGPPAQTVAQKEDVKESEEQRDGGRAARQGVRDDLKVEKEDQRERATDRLSAEKEGGHVGQKEQEVETVREEEQMEVTEEGQSHTERAEEEKIKDEEEGESTMDQSDHLRSPALHQNQNVEPIQTSAKDSSVEPKPILGLISAPVQTPASVPEPGPAPEVSVQSQRLPESQRDVQPVGPEDFCENMSTQSDNQSGTSRTHTRAHTYTHTHSYLTCCLCSSQRCPASPLSPPPPRPSSPPQQKMLRPSSPPGPPTQLTSANHSTRSGRSTKQSRARLLTWLGSKPPWSPSANWMMTLRALANH